MRFKLLSLATLAVIAGLFALGTSERAIAATTLDVPSVAYPTIQDAVTAAVDGDTILVAAGSYPETLVVDKRLTIRGAGSGSTIIDALGLPGNGIMLQAGGLSASERLTISGLTVQNATSSGIRAEVGGGFDLDYVTLDDVVLSNNGDRGMEIHNLTVVTDMVISNSEFTGNTNQGLRTASDVIVNGLTIADSSFNGNSYGIYLQGSIGNVSIARSEFDNSVGGYGAYMTETGPLTNLAIQDSQFNGNVVGLLLWNEQDNQGIAITGTTFRDNDAFGLALRGASLADVLVSDSIIADNDQWGLGYRGIDFSTQTDVMTNVAVHFSSITGHSVGGGMKNRDTSASAIVDATGNWWGDVSGPEDAEDADGLNQFNPDGLGNAVTEYILYDPWIGQSGLVTGGGTIWSEAGAYAWEPDAAGPAIFGFVSRYKAGRSVPDGHTNFIFKAGGLHFNSSGYDRLAIGGNTAIFKGTGTIDGVPGDYKFTIWAGDADPDTFRIRIWEEVGDVEEVVYDNGSNQPITDGNIFIHQKAGKS